MAKKDKKIQKITELKPNQKRFCEFYVKNANAYQAAIEAGYSKATAKNKSSEWVEKGGFKNYINKLQQEIKNENIMDAREIQERLTAIARGEIKEECVVIEGSGEGCSSATLFEKQVTPKDQLKALDTLAKINNLYNDATNITVELPQIIDDI